LIPSFFNSGSDKFKGEERRRNRKPMNQRLRAATTGISFIARAIEQGPSLSS
jgi:hypothetical protein